MKNIKYFLFSTTVVALAEGNSQGIHFLEKETLI